MITRGLPTLLADTHTPNITTHSFHGSVTGPMFNTLHTMFMVQYTGLRNAVNPIAQRIERFNGRISEIVSQTRFSSVAALESTLMRHLSTYNHNIPQRALNHQTPIQALKTWRAEMPSLFKKSVMNLPGLDN
jgi:DNA-binding ferritin-like protein